MSSATLTLAIMLAATAQVDRYGTIRKDELVYQKEAFAHWWGTELNFKLADLPKEGKVPDFRVPYAGHDYPDRIGGTQVALSKYDQAFHRAPKATQWERNDIIDHRAGRHDGQVEYRRGLFGRMRAVRVRGPAVPSWYGHCNGWTAASIRHAEPQKSVVRNGVTFTPSDIKGLLAEIYMYSASEHLGGLDEAINPGILHVSLANWLGLGSHPVGMETALGETVINFPIYSYQAKVNKLTERQYEVQNTITYALNTPREYDKGPKQNRTMYFHYVLDLNADGTITGGRYYGDSARIDMLWAALKPVQGGEKGNERGCPHVNVKEVLAIWRESVPEEIRKQWLNVDPTEEDRILPEVAEVAPAEAAPAEATAAAVPAEALPAEAAPAEAAAADASASVTETTPATSTAADSPSAPAEATPPATESDPPTVPAPQTVPAPTAPATPEPADSGATP
jgi:hypothetical protein